MLDALEEGNLADSSGRDAIVFLLKSDLLEGHKVASDQVFALVDHTVSAFSELLETLVAFELLRVVAELLLLAVVGLRRVELLVAGGVLILHYFLND